MSRVHFITGNAGKWAIARDIFAKAGVALDRLEAEAPELQSLDVTEVALFAARHVQQHTGLDVIKSDVGYYIPALGNFPGPFIKYINQTLTTDNLLALMHGKTDRRVVLRECLAYAGANGVTRFFTSEQVAHLALAAEGSGSPIDQLLVLPGFTRPKGACPPDQIFAHWTTTLGLYNEMAEFLAAR